MCNYIFAMQLLEISLCLAVAGTLCILSEAEAQLGPLTEEALKRISPTIVASVPYFWKKINTSLLPELKIAIASGDRLSFNTVVKWKKSFPALRFVNCYGATEVLMLTMTSDLSNGPTYNTVPVGRPVSLYSSMHVLDQNLQRLPIGVAGEIYCGGSCPSLGYTDNNKTAAAFFRSPLSEGPLYKTNDRGFWNFEGQLCLLGRADFIIKLRGLRIDPGDIEATVKRNDAIADCVVVPYAADSEGGNLIAFVTFMEGKVAPRSSDLRLLCVKFLPLFMVPAFFYVLDALPRTGTGKVNRIALLDLVLVEAWSDTDVQIVRLTCE